MNTSKEYRQEAQRLKEELKKDLFQEYDLTNHPKADKAFEMAWDQGHHAGFREVSEWFRDLAELIK